jgi:hypothetical protein
MNQAEKRVVIAKDVLEQLRTQKFIAKCGAYVDDQIHNLDVFWPAEYGASLQAALPKVKNCKVCALGAVFMSKVNKFNRFNVGDSLNSEDLRANLKGIFSYAQLFLIEAAFEGDGNDAGAYYVRGCPEDVSGALTDKDRRAAFEFCRRHEDADTRLKAIMRNIVRNKGTFVLPKSCFKTSKKAS